MSNQLKQNSKLISVIIPVFNEAENIQALQDRLQNVMLNLTFDYEIIYVNDGSQDGTAAILSRLAENNSKVKVIEFSRNFGKEVAITAGLNLSKGDAGLMIDADLQHPPELIPEFIKLWQNGAEIVIGLRQKNRGEGIIKRLGSFVFYKLINKISETEIMPRATDYRLLDRIVVDEFNKLTEKNRLARGLVDWLGFRRAYVYFVADRRHSGPSAYNVHKLFRSALNSIVSFSLLPLRLAGYLGLFIVVVAGGFGFVVLVGKYILSNPFFQSFSGSAQLAILIIFLVGIILCCLGLIALYIANIHNEVVDRPLYVVRKKINTK